jgi:hypothetical protein
MARPNPYYTNDKEARDLVKLRNDFVFDTTPVSSKFIVVISGAPGDGKTHLACTMNSEGPVYILDSEYRAHHVIKKFQDVYVKTVTGYREIVVAVKHILKEKKTGTIVLDSGSDFQQFAETEYLNRTGKTEVGMPYNWGEVYWLLNSLIDDIKFSDRFHLVFTARLAEEYVNDKGTGRMLPKIYKNIPYKADVSVIFSKRIPAFLKTIHGNLDVKLARTMTLPDMLKLAQDIPQIIEPVKPPGSNPLSQLT